jgi:hypothetical protein
MALPNALNIYNFPDAYDSLVDAFTGTIKYISASTGSNSNTGNSVGAAYLTIDYALAQNTSATATMFVILEGTYTITPTSVNGSSVGLTDGGNHREFVCAPGRVIIQHTANSAGRDSAIFHFANTSSKIYGAIIKRNNNGRTTSYEVAYFKSASAKGNFYNCVFSETNANNAWSYQYDNYGTNNLALRNCTFYHLAAPSGNYTNAGTCLTIDSVFNTTVTTGGTETNVLKSQTVNATTYVTTGVTTAGVYSGTYAWDGLTTFPPGFGPLTPSTVVSGSTINLTYYHATSSATVSYTITGISSADINNTSLTGSLTVTNYATTISIPTKAKVNTTNTLTITIESYTASITITPGMTVRYLVVAGGGGAGSNMGGGGGAGGYLAGTDLSVAGSYTITVGAGGAGAIAGTASPAGSNGQDTTALGLTAIGGGGGASSHDTSGSPAGNGGSGGGGSGARQSAASYGGLPGTGTAGQGNNGAGSGVTWYPGGGGGSAAAATQTGSQQADGGAGTLNNITGSSLYWAGGGAGAGYSVYGGNGGIGGGGGGAPRQGAGTTNGTGGGSALNSGSVAEIGTIGAQTNKRGGAGGVNTGSGGGGGSHYSVTNEGGAGGSGIVVIRYAGSQRATGGTVTTVSSDTVHTFLTSGVFATPAGGLTSTHTSAYWGETVTISYGDDLADGSTVAYTITGVTSTQIGGASLTGNFTISTSTASLAINLATLSTATTATMVITAGAYSTTTTISNIISFVSSTPGTYWGGTTTFTATIRGLTSGGLVPYTISGVTSAQISNASLTGNATNVLAVPGYSASFNGTTSKLSIPASADFAFGTGSFTIEFWIKTTDGACDILTQTTASSPNWGIVITGSTLYWQSGYAAASLYSIALSSLTSNPTSGSWTHVAITRNGSGTGNLRFWINGVGQTAHSGNDTTNYTGQGPIQISGPGTGYGFFTGNISNLRIVKGVAVYTGTFTVPTSPLTATQSSGTNISAIIGTQTSLLCCQSATVIDNSAAVRTITNTDVTVSSDAPIGNTTLAALSGGTATLTVVTNPTEPILNSATMVTAITGGSNTSVIRTGNPKLIGNLSPSIQSLEYIDTEVTDIHSSVLESTVNTVDTVTSITIGDIIDSTLQSIEYIDTEITDIHAQTLEATIATVATITTGIIGEIERTEITGITPAPTYAYSSGEEIVTEEQGAATVSQIWTLS